MNIRTRNLLAMAMATALGAALVAPLASAEPQSLTGAVRGQVGVQVPQTRLPQTRLPTRSVERAVDRTTDVLERARERAERDRISAAAQGTVYAAGHAEVVQREVWARLDFDGDGRISAAEAQADAALQASFGMIDVNQDGFITDAEYYAHAQAMVAQGAEHAAGHSMAVTSEVWTRLDADGDGRISAAEADADVDAGFNANFAAMDSDGDGFVTEAEFRAHAKVKVDPVTL